MDYFISLYRFLWICMEQNQTINPFLINLDLKEPYLVYWLCFGLGLIDCNPQLRNIYIKGIFVLGEMLSKFLQNPCFCFGHNLAITHPN